MTTTPGSGSTAGFGKIFSAELLKSHRAAPKKIILLSLTPHLIVAILLVLNNGMGVRSYVWNSWYTLVLPIAVAVLCAWVANIDAKQHLRTILGLPISMGGVWWAKCAYIFLLSLARSCGILVISTVAGFFGTDSISITAGVISVLMISVAISWMIPVGLFLTFRFGTLVAIVIPLIIQQASLVVLANTRIWWLFPAATTSRAVTPFVGVAPSAVPLAPGQPMLDITWQTWASMGVALVVSFVFAALGARWFARQESR